MKVKSEGEQGFAVSGGVFKIQENLVRGFLIVCDHDADRMVTAEAGSGEKGRCFDVGIGFRIEYLPEEGFLRGCERKDGEEEEYEA